jgi:hypothetical protein
MNWLAGAAGFALSPALKAEPDFTAYSDKQKEDFLRQATIVSVVEIGHGVTKPRRAMMELRGVSHSAQIQVVNKGLSDFFGEDGSRPVPMMDSWRFNIAAYKLDRLLGLNMVTVAVRREFESKPGAFSWWVDDVMFEEVDRVKKGLEAPDKEDFERQRAVSRVFDELVINIDRNLSNLLITKSWRLALIDHTRCFTPYPGIRNKANLTRCSKALLASMKKLDAAGVSGAVGKHLSPVEVKALLGRRDKIVAFFEQEVKAKGEPAVLFD